MSRRAKKLFSRDEHGAVTIEFVVTLPLFLATLAFAFEFGQIFLAHQSTVNNVRAATRYLSRSDLSATDLTEAENLIRTGRLVGGTAPEWLADADVAIDTAYSAFGPPDFSRAGNTVRIVTRVDYPLSIFGFASDDGIASIPFVVVEDFRFIGA